MLGCRLAGIEHADEIEAHEGGADGGHGGEAPLHDAGAAGLVGRDQLAGLSGQVERDGGRFGHHEATIVDERRLVEGADAAVGLAIELAPGVVERVDAVRQADFLERPLRPEVFGLTVAFGEDAAEAVEGDHGRVPPDFRFSPAPGPEDQVE